MGQEMWMGHVGHGPLKGKGSLFV